MESSQALHAEHSTKDPLIANELGSTSTSSQDEQARGNWHSVPQVTYGSYAQPYPAYVHGQGPHVPVAPIHFVNVDLYESQLSQFGRTPEEKRDFVNWIHKEYLAYLTIKDLPIIGLDGKQIGIAKFYMNGSGVTPWAYIPVEAFYNEWFLLQGQKYKMRHNLLKRIIWWFKRYLRRRGRDVKLIGQRLVGFFVH